MIVTISFRANPEKRAQLVDTLASILPDTRDFAGCNSVILVERTDHSGDLLLIEDWETNADYEAYKSWRQSSGTSVLGSDLVDATSLVSQSYEHVT